MNILAFARQFFCNAQERCMVLDWDQPADTTDHDAPFRNAVRLANLSPHARSGCKFLTVHAVVNYAEAIRPQPGLPGMITSQVLGHRENGVCHTEKCATHDAPA